jgi:hypothetical protein
LTVARAGCLIRLYAAAANTALNRIIHGVAVHKLCFAAQESDIHSFYRPLAHGLRLRCVRPAYIL